MPRIEIEVAHEGEILAFAICLQLDLRLECAITIAKHVAGKRAGAEFLAATRTMSSFRSQFTSPSPILCQKVRQQGQTLDAIVIEISDRDGKWSIDAGKKRTVKYAIFHSPGTLPARWCPERRCDDDHRR